MFKAALMVEGTMPIGNVVLLGLGTVFVGLISIVILCWLMGKIVSPAEKKKGLAGTGGSRTGGSRYPEPAGTGRSDILCCCRGAGDRCICDSHTVAEKTISN